MTAEIIQFDNYLRRKRATGKALADEALAEAALPAQFSEQLSWESLNQIQRRRDELNQQSVVDHRTWEQVHKSLENLSIKLAAYSARLGPSRLDE